MGYYPCDVPLLTPSGLSAPSARIRCASASLPKLLLREPLERLEHVHPRGVHNPRTHRGVVPEASADLHTSDVDRRGTASDARRERSRLPSARLEARSEACDRHESLLERRARVRDASAIVRRALLLLIVATEEAHPAEREIEAILREPTFPTTCRHAISTYRCSRE
jgi:hypothetical protein